MNNTELSNRIQNLTEAEISAIIGRSVEKTPVERDIFEGQKARFLGDDPRNRSKFSIVSEILRQIEEKNSIVIITRRINKTPGNREFNGRKMTNDGDSKRESISVKYLFMTQSGIFDLLSGRDEGLSDLIWNLEMLLGNIENSQVTIIKNGERETLKLIEGGIEIREFPSGLISPIAENEPARERVDRFMRAIGNFIPELAIEEEIEILKEGRQAKK